VRGVRLTLRGQLRASPRARWISFTAEETLEAQRSEFRWKTLLRTVPASTRVVTDRYEGGHGRVPRSAASRQSRT